MIEAIAIAVAVCVVAGLGWDVLRKREANAHTRLLAQDRYQEMQRACTTLELRSKAVESKLDAQKTAIEEFYSRFALLKEQRLPLREEFEDLVKLATHTRERTKVNEQAIESCAVFVRDELLKQRQTTDGLLATRRMGGIRT